MDRPLSPWERMTMNRLAILPIGLLACLLLPGLASSQPKVYRAVSNEMLEKILQGLELKYQKEERKNKDASIMLFDFKRGDLAYRLYNYQNDLWIECTFDRKLKPEEVNRWNAEAKFSRLVVVEQKEKTMLSLESQLDCLGGVTDASIRQYLNRFEAEAKKFAKSTK